MQNIFIPHPPASTQAQVKAEAQAQTKDTQTCARLCAQTYTHMKVHIHAHMYIVPHANTNSLTHLLDLFLCPTRIPSPTDSLHTPTDYSPLHPRKIVFAGIFLCPFFLLMRLPINRCKHRYLGMLSLEVHTFAFPPNHL